MNDFLNVTADVCRRLKITPYLVGGTVRDQLAGRPSHDWDFVCPQAKKAAQAVARRLSAKLITLDEKNRIYRIVLPDRLTLDFAEMQGKTVQQDLARRDFTINAMALEIGKYREVQGNTGKHTEKDSNSLSFPVLPRASLSFHVIDPFHGQRDLKKRVLRALSRKAFQDDALRLLRAYRMTAQFDLTVEPRTDRWIAAESRRLEGRSIARERVREEFLRLLSQPRCAPALWKMDQKGLLTGIFPELEAGRRVGKAYYGKGGVMKHHLQSVENTEWLLEKLRSDAKIGFLPNAQVREKIQAYVNQPLGGVTRAAFLKLGALLHDIGKPATAQVIKGRLRFFGHEDVGAQMVMRVLAALRFSRQEGVLIRMWVRNHMRPGNLASVPVMTPKAAARFFRDMGEDGVGMLLVSLADHYTYLARRLWAKGSDPVEKTSGRLLETYYLRREKVLPARVIDGHVLMKKLRLKPGPQIGKLLEAVRDAQAEGKVKTAEDAVAFARRILKN